MWKFSIIYKRMKICFTNLESTQLATKITWNCINYKMTMLMFATTYYKRKMWNGLNNSIPIYYTEPLKQS